MVLQHAHSFHGGFVFRLDRARIAAGAGAIAINVAVFLLLLIPAGMPSLVPQADHAITIVPIIDRMKPPLPPVPPEEVKVVKPAKPVTRAPVQPDLAPPVADPVVVDEGSLPADEVVEPAVGAAPDDIAPDSSPIAGMRLQYADAPSPPYPRDALIAGLQGTVLLQVLVDVDGRPLQVDIRQSSGHRKLDEAARRFVLKHWTFQPATKNGQRVQAVGIVPIAFNLG
jgi:protein TonB